MDKDILLHRLQAIQTLIVAIQGMDFSRERRRETLLQNLSRDLHIEGLGLGLGLSLDLSERHEEDLRHIPLHIFRLREEADLIR